MPSAPRAVEAGRLTDTHMGRLVSCNGLSGTLDGVIPIGGRVQLHLRIGQTRVFLDPVPAVYPIIVHPK